MSDKTAELVDIEVKRILEASFDRAREILREKIDILHRMAEALLDRETLGREDVIMIVEGKELPALGKDSGGIDELLPRPLDRGESASDGGVLGTPPAEPAGA